MQMESCESEDNTGGCDSVILFFGTHKKNAVDKKNSSSVSGCQPPGSHPQTDLSRLVRTSHPNFVLYCAIRYYNEY